MARNYVITEGSSIIDVTIDSAYFVEADPIWMSEKINYYTKTEIDDMVSVLPPASSGDIVTTEGAQDIYDKTLVSPVLNGSLSGTALDNDPTFLANSPTKVPTQQAVLALHNSAFISLVPNRPVFTDATSKLINLTPAQAINSLLPNQFGNSGKFLTTDGLNVFWQENTTTETQIANSASQQLIVNSLTVVDYPVPSELTLPLDAKVGDTVEIAGGMNGGWKILQNAGQQIFFGDRSTTIGELGYIESTHFGDCIKLVCISEDVGWRVVSVIGNINIE